MAEGMTPTVGRDRMIKWIEQAVSVGRWPASLEGNEGKFMETAVALVELVNRAHLRIEVVHRQPEPGPGDNHRPSGGSASEPWLVESLRRKP